MKILDKENKMADERIEMLDEDTNFFEWQSKILKVLRLKGVQDVITGDIQNRRKNEKAALLIVKNVSPKFTSNLQSCKTAKEMMLKLESHFCYKTVFEKLHIKKQLLNLNSEPFENLQSHFHKFDVLMSKLKDLNCEMGETDKVFHLLFTLLDRYDSLISSLDKSFGNAFWEDILTLDCIKTTLLDYEAALLAEMCIENDGNASFIDCEEKKVIELCGDLTQQFHDKKHSSKEAGQFSRQLSNDNSGLEHLQNNYYTCIRDQSEHYSDIISNETVNVFPEQTNNENIDDCSSDVRELEDEGSRDIFDAEVCKTEHESMCVLKEPEIVCQRVLESQVLLRDIAKDLHCFECNKWFLTPMQLTQHRMTHNMSLTLPYSLPPNHSNDFDHRKKLRRNTSKKKKLPTNAFHDYHNSSQVISLLPPSGLQTVPPKDVSINDLESGPPTDSINNITPVLSTLTISPKDQITMSSEESVVLFDEEANLDEDVVDDDNTEPLIFYDEEKVDKMAVSDLVNENDDDQNDHTNLNSCGSIMELNDNTLKELCKEPTRQSSPKTESDKNIQCISPQDSTNIKSNLTCNICNIVLQCEKMLIQHLNTHRNILKLSISQLNCHSNATNVPNDQSDNKIIDNIPTFTSKHNQSRKQPKNSNISAKNRKAEMLTKTINVSNKSNISASGQLLITNFLDNSRETTDEIRSTKVIQLSEKPVTPVLEDVGSKHIDIQLPTVTELSETPDLYAEYQCNYCEKAFKMIISLHTHIGKCHIERPYYCHVCRKPFDRKDLDKHLKTHDDVRVEGQELTAEASTTEIKDTLPVHTTFNVKQTRGVCDICGRSFGSRHHAKMLVHRNSHTGFQTYACDLCGKLFSHDTTLKTHIKHKHSIEKPYACEVCGIKFAVKMFYQRHKLTHTERNHPCKICDKTYSRQSDLDKHVLQKHEKRFPFVCFVCGKGFLRKSLLRYHSEIHTGNYSASKSLCPICGKSVSTVSFKSHFNYHNKEKVKRFECDICGYKTVTKAKLSDHMSKHMTDKPYKCNVCKKRFRLKLFLDRHKPTHAKDGQKYSCSVCGQRFFHKHTLVRHMRTPHSDRTPRLKVMLKE